MNTTNTATARTWSQIVSWRLPSRSVAFAAPEWGPDAVTRIPVTATPSSASAARMANGPRRRSQLRVQPRRASRYQTKAMTAAPRPRSANRKWLPTMTGLSPVSTVTPPSGIWPDGHDRGGQHPSRTCP